MTELKNLITIREALWDIQEKLEKENRDEHTFSVVYQQLGELSNTMMRYIHGCLERSASQEELLSNVTFIINESKEPLPYFLDLKTHLEALINGDNILVGDEYQKNMHDTAQELLEKVNG